MANAVIEIKGIEGLLKHLADAQKMDEVKQVVKSHTASLDKKMVANAQFTKGYSTGATKRSITPEILDGGLTGKVSAGTDYSGYLEEGTRFMEAQPFAKPALKSVEPKFVADLKGVME